MRHKWTKSTTVEHTRRWRPEPMPLADFFADFGPFTRLVPETGR
jgi:hypothetical protein